MPPIKKVSQQQEQAPITNQHEQHQSSTNFNLTGEAARIWEEIKDRPIEMFALPNQIVSDHVTPFPVDPSKLYCFIRSTAVLPSLEAACNLDKREKFNVEAADKYVMVSATVQIPVVPPVRK